jgi:Fe-S-cluster containining protein
VQAVRTLGQLVDDEQILAWIEGTVTDIIRHASHGAEKRGRRLSLAVSCTSCRATKTCCWSMVVARLYEGVLIAAELVRTGRDAPALRDELRARAEAMEAAAPQDWRTPCVFLDERERCTIYGVRPVPCGSLLVYTDPVLCTTRAGEILGYVPAEEQAAATAFEEEFRERLALRRKAGRRYVGVLPWPTDEDIARWGRPTT